MPKLFRITDPYSVEQFYLIRKLLYKYSDIAMIVYQSNWYITIACLDWYTANEIKYQLNIIKSNWYIEIRPGRKNKIRHYLQIKLLRE